MCGTHVIMCVLMCHCVVSALLCTCVQVDARVCDHVHEPCARVDAHVQGMCAFAWWLCVVILCLLTILTGWERVLCVSVHEESLVRSVPCAHLCQNGVCLCVSVPHGQVVCMWA